MKLAIISPYPPSITGIGQYGYYVSQLLAESSLFKSIHVLTSRAGGRPSSPGPANPQIKMVWQPESLRASGQILSSLRRLQPDLVWFNLGASIFGHSPLANLAGFLSPHLARAMGFPTVVTLHELVELADLRALESPGGPLAPIGAHLLTGLALQADVVCLTMQRYVAWLNRHHPAKRAFHIPLGAYHAPEQLPKPTHAGRELLFFTTLAPYKGLELLLEAYENLLPAYPDLRLTIAGAEHVRFPGYGAELKLRTAHLPAIRWLGKVPEDQVRELYRQADLICIPYTASTGSSSVLYQAATWGRAVVASDLEELRCVARESSLQAAFFRSGSSASLESKLKSMLASPDLIRSQVEWNFSAIQRIRPEDACQAYLRAFNLALETRRSPMRLPVSQALERRTV